MKLSFALIFLALISLYSCIDYEVTLFLAANGTCNSAQLYTCYPCTNQQGITTYNMAYANSNTVYVYTFQYSNPTCDGTLSAPEMYNSDCDDRFQCTFFYQVAYKLNELTVTSTSPITATFLTGAYEIPIETTISQLKITALGYLGGVRIISDGYSFTFESQLSETQYSTSLGIYNYDQTYTSQSLTFSATILELNAPPTYGDYIIDFAPFISVSVIGEEEYSFFYAEGQVQIETDSTFSLSGLSVSNPYYGLTNMTFFPAYNENSYSDGKLVFQFTGSSPSPFVTLPCEYAQDESLSLVIYFCDLGSSFPYGFSLDQFEVQKNDDPDRMAFSLF